MWLRFKEWRRRSELAKIKRLQNEIVETRRKNSVLNELVESLSMDLELLEEMCGEIIVQDAENILLIGDSPERTQEGEAQAERDLTDAFSAILFCSDEVKEQELRSAGIVLGGHCADNYLCPMATSIALFRLASIDSDLAPELATEIIVFAMREGIAQRFQERTQ
jgi:hypothetical protein